MPTCTVMRRSTWPKLSQVEQIPHRSFPEKPCARRAAPRAGPHSRRRALAAYRAAGPFFISAMLLFLCSGAAAHPPWAEFADWFRTLKEPGTDAMMDGSISCCTPSRDCHMTDYETDAEGRYWIIAEGERIQVPSEKMLQRTDNPTGRAVACLRYLDGHPIVRCFVRPPEG
jgi:hypothetical protein